MNKIFPKILIASFFLLITAPYSAYAANLFIAPDGNDNNDGSVQRPFASFSKASEIAKAGDVVYVFGGEYNITTPQTIASSGTKDAIIAYRAYNEEVPMLNGEGLTDDNAAMLEVAGSHIEISGLELMGSAGHGISVMNGENVLISDNTISASTRSAIKIDGSGSNNTQNISILRNELMDNGLTNSTPANPLGAITVKMVQGIKLQDNTINDNSIRGVVVSDSSGGNIVGNEIYDNSISNLHLDDVKDIQMNNNKIHRTGANESTNGITISTSQTSNAETLQGLSFMNNLITDTINGVSYDNEAGDNIAIKGATFDGNVFYTSESGVLNFAAPKTGQHDINFTNNIFASTDGTFVSPDSTLSGSTFANNCWAEPGTIPAEVEGNGNVQTTLTALNRTMPKSATGNLRATGELCRDIAVDASQYEVSAPSDTSFQIIGGEAAQGTTPTNTQPTNTVTIPLDQENADSNEASTTATCSSNSSATSTNIPAQASRMSFGGFGSGGMMSFIKTLISSIFDSILSSIFGIEAPAPTQALAPEQGCSDTSTTQSNTGNINSSSSSSSDSSGGGSNSNNNTVNQNNAPTTNSATPAANNSSNSSNSSTPAPSNNNTNNTTNNSPTAAGLQAVNTFRGQNGLPPLTEDPLLERAAKQQSDAMARALKMSHTVAGALGGRVTSAGYNWRSVAENVAVGQRSYPEVVEAWINSPPHRANLLNSSVTELGFGVTNGSDGRPYWTVILASPR